MVELMACHMPESIIFKLSHKEVVVEAHSSVHVVLLCWFHCRALLFYSK